MNEDRFLTEGFIFSLSRFRAFAFIIGMCCINNDHNTTLAFKQKVKLFELSYSVRVAIELFFFSFILLTILLN